MTDYEKALFKELCCFRAGSIGEDLIRFASPSVLGHLFFNRMQGVAYDNLKQNGFLSKVHREFRSSLKAAYEQNVEKNRSYFMCVRHVSDLLTSHRCRAAFLKGAVLCARYPQGYRTSQDIDLLVLPEDVTAVGRCLQQAGFVQGYLKGDVFIPASREEILRSKMMRGETVPYIKEVDLPHMSYLEVDINFSLDYKSGTSTALSSMLSKAGMADITAMSIFTLSQEDFFLHLCAHLHKEATTLPWIEMRRDMTLYKYADIYLLLSDMGDAEVERVFARAQELGLQDVCAYAVEETSNLFSLPFGTAQKLAREIFALHGDAVAQIVDPQNKRRLLYRTKDATERFFMEDRRTDLKEVL